MYSYVRWQLGNNKGRDRRKKNPTPAIKRKLALDRSGMPGIRTNSAWNFIRDDSIRRSPGPREGRNGISPLLIGKFVPGPNGNERGNFGKVATQFTGNLSNSKFEYA